MTSSISSIPLSTPTRQDPAHKTVRAIDLSPIDAEPQHTPSNDRAATLLKDFHPLHQIKTQVQVRVGEAEVTVGELVNAKDGQVLKLNRQIDEAVDLLIEGHVVARGHLVALDGQFAIRISELPQPLSLHPRG
jgi:flagellar motor switch protein FliN